MQTPLGVTMVEEITTRYCCIQFVINGGFVLITWETAVGGIKQPPRSWLRVMHRLEEMATPPLLPLTLPMKRMVE
jgi:hypothetical protein